MSSKENNIALWELLQYTAFLSQKLRQRELNQYNITLRTSAVLKTIIKFGEEVMLSQIVGEIGLELHSLAAQITRMEKEGLVVKSKDRKKRNLMHIRITDKGKKKLEKIHDEQSIDSIMSVLTDEEQQQLWEILIKIRQQTIMELSQSSYNIFNDVPTNLKDYTPRLR